jgi:DNA-directed RNA polymerase specialized sigma24 family protein
MHDRLLVNAAFPKTEWTLVNAVGQADPAAKQIALESVLVRYLPILKGHVAMQYRVPEEQAEDWVQSFVLKKVLEKDLIAQADQRRGKFRTFLLRALHNFIIQQIRRDQASKRSPAGESIQIDDLTEQDLAKIVEKHSEAFDVAWARGVLVETVQRMERQCAAAGRTDVWGVFECRILKPMFEETEPLPYEQLVERFGLQSPAQASNVLITAKRMYGRILRSVVAEYAKDEKEVEREITDLKGILYHA